MAILNMTIKVLHENLDLYIFMYHYSLIYHTIIVLIKYCYSKGENPWCRSLKSRISDISQSLFNYTVNGKIIIAICSFQY